MPQSKLTPSTLSYPFTKQEREKLETELSLSHKLSNDLIPLSTISPVNPTSTLDEIDVANNFQYFTFRETTKIHLHSCAQMLSQSAIVLKFVSKLDAGFSSVEKETNSIQETCNALLAEQHKLSTLSEEIDKNLKIFNNLEMITRKLNTPGADFVTRPSFSQLLDNLDEGLLYVEKHKNFKDIERYQQRFRHCMTRALSLIQVYFQNTLKYLSNEILEKTSKITNVGNAHQVLLYSKFESESPSLLKLTTEISKRMVNHSEYEGLLNDCIKAYFATRHRLLLPRINHFLDEAAKEPGDIVQFTRSLLVFYRELCAQEFGLFKKIFYHSELAFVEWYTDICSSLYDVVRQRIIREVDIGLLCELASLFLSYKEEEEDQQRENEYEENQKWSRRDSNLLSPVSSKHDPLATEPEKPFTISYFELFKPILQDVQARLLFRAQAYVEQEIVRHVPTEEDLHGLSGRRKKSKQNSSSAKPSEFDVDNIFSAWYPPMRKAIALLSQINQLVNSTTFDDLAHRIVHECLVSLQAAHALAVTRLGKLEADLFLIKHLLILGNQITEFDIEYVPSDVHFDFSGISEVISLLRTGGVSLNRANLLNLAKISVPKVVNNMFDAKEELYAKLRNTIHNFTEEAVKIIIEPITRPECTPETALADTRQLRENAATEIPKLRKLMLDNYLDDIRTVDILIDSIQDLVIQSYEEYHEKIIAEAAKISKEMGKDETDVIDGLMEVEGLMAWFGDIIGTLHREKLSGAEDSVQNRSPSPTVSEN